MDLGITPDNAKGGLRAFSFAKNDTRLASNDSSSGGPWSKSWGSRMRGFPFRLKANEKADLVFLTDIVPVPVFNLTYGWNKQYNFPQTDFVRAMGVEMNEEGLAATGQIDIYEQVLGQQARLIGAAVVLDLRPWQDKEGNQHSYSIRPIEIKQQSILAALSEVAAINSRDIKNAVFRVSRSGGQKVAAIGDVWTHLKYVETADLFEKLSAKDSNLTMERLTQQPDPLSWYPVHTPEEAAQLLSLHASVVSKHDAGKGNLDERALEAAKKGDWGYFGGSQENVPFANEGEDFVAPSSSGGGLADLDGDDVLGDAFSGGEEEFSI